MLDEFPSDHTSRWVCCNDTLVFGIGSALDRCTEVALVPLVLCFESLGLSMPVPANRGRDIVVLTDHISAKGTC